MEPVALSYSRPVTVRLWLLSVSIKGTSRSPGRPSLSILEAGVGKDDGGVRSMVKKRQQPAAAAGRIARG